MPAQKTGEQVPPYQLAGIKVCKGAALVLNICLYVAAECIGLPPCEDVKIFEEDVFPDEVVQKQPEAVRGLDIAVDDNPVKCFQNPIDFPIELI